MIPVTFQKEMDRLADTFGAYKNERMQLIWLEVKDMPDDWFRATVNDLIGSQRQAPLVDNFRDAVTQWRESDWKQKKKQYAEEAQAFTTRFQSEDLKLICDTIGKRVEGALDDHQWTSFLRMINITAHDSKFNLCNYCEESGILFRKEGDYEFVYRCSCAYGDRHSNLKTLNMGHRI